MIEKNKPSALLFTGMTSVCQAEYRKVNERRTRDKTVNKGWYSTVLPSSLCTSLHTPFYEYV